MKRLISLILILSAAVTCAFCGIHDIRFSQIGIDKGLSHSTVNGISRDSYGYIWVATPAGLNRYDGFEFKTLLPDSIDHNIKSVAASDNGTIWAITSHILSKYSVSTETFDNYTFPHKASLTAVLPVEADRIAVGTTDGLYYFTLADRTFTLIPETLNENITAITKSGNDIIVGTVNGKITILSPSGTQNFTLPGNPEINVLLRDKKSLLIGTEGRGLFVYTQADKHLENIGKDKGIDYVRSILIDSQGRLWVGTFTGLYIFDPERKNIVFHEDATASDGALSHSSVRRMFSDNQGGIWLGTYYGGLNYYHPLLNQFATISKHNLNNQSISGNIAGPLAEDSKGNIWIGTNNGGLNIYTPRTGDFKKRTRKDGLGSDDVKAIYIDEERNKAYIGTHIGGLSVADLSSGKISTLNNIAQSVYGITPALNKSHLWLATLDGVSILNVDTHSYRKITAPYMPALTTNIMRDWKNRLWISGEDGLSVYSEGDGNLTYIPELPHLTFQVNDVYQSRNTGLYWIATHRGLLCYDEKERKTSHYTSQDGLPGDIVYAILEDPTSNIWATTNRGLICLNQSTGKIMTYNNRDGMKNSQFTDRSALYATNGLMYFGGINGLTYFNPTIMEKNTFAPNPLIEGVRLFNKPVAPGDDTGILSKGILEADEIVFNSSQTNFSIDFTACDYVSKGDNTFMYTLDGLDKQWMTLPAGSRSVAYSNLPSGTYTFRLRAANNDGVWSDEEASIKVVILPPWYKTWWAISIAILLVLAAVFFSTRYIWKRKSREKIRKAQQEINEMKVRFFVNMSHELRTPLTLMLLPITDLIASKPDPATLQKLTTVRNNTLRIRHIVNQLLDYRRAELGMFKLSVAELDINALMSDILESYRSIAENKHIKFNFNSTITNSRIYADANYLELIVNNLVTNAFKYTPEGGEITVNISETDGKLQLSVADTGCGIPTDKLDKIFTRFYQLNDSVGGYGIGLSLVKRLVELHHGTISVQSEVGKGSRFVVSVPMKAGAYTAEETATAPLKRESHSEDISVLLPINEETENTTDASESADGRKTILVVDDNAEILKYLSAALSNDFRVLTAANGNKAIEVLGADTVDLVISDVMMPDMDGVQLCRAIKRNLRTSHIPVIMLSAKADVADRLEGFKVGADDYIAKPFQTEELMAKVRNLIRTRESIILHYSRTTAPAIEPTEIAQNPLDEEFLKKAIKVMNEHLDDSQFTTDEFAREMCMSRSNLHLKMKALTGESTNDFIRRTRLKKAAELLKTHRYTVAEVSAMVGYNTPSYFATSFKNFFGHSPSSLTNQQ